MARIRMSDIAELAGVSTATVSRMLHTPDQVKESTRRRIQSVIEETGYVYDSAAGDFSRQTTSLFGLIVPTMKSSIHAELIHGIQAKIRPTRYSLTIGNTDYDTDVEISLFSLFRQRRVAGIITTGLHPELQPLAEAAMEDGVPVIVVWDTLTNGGASYVGFDNYQAAYKMTDYLLRLGHRRIALIMGPLHKEARVQKRFDGYCAALASYGVEAKAEYAIEKEPTLIDGREAMTRLLALEEPPTAVFAASDVLAMGALAGAKDHGLRVPGDISIAGFDDIDFASFCDPPLTTVRVPAFEMGQIAGGILLDYTSNRSRDRQRYSLETSLVVRRSCAPPTTEQLSRVDV